MSLDQRVIDLYDEYTHRPLPRRVFMERLVGLAGSVAAAHAALGVLEPNYARAAVVAPDDPRIVAGSVEASISGTPLRGLLAEPKGAAKSAAVLVVHENRGLNPHIQDITRRLAVDGFLAFGLDFLSPLGGTPADADTARDMFGKLTPEQVLAQAQAGVAFLKGHPKSNGKVGAVGFCWGGGVVNRMATSIDALDAGVVFYGVSPNLQDVARIRAPLLLNYAGLDERINAGVPAYEAALKAAGKRYTVHMYPGVNHAFNNDTSAERYDKAAATLAWERTITFFRKELAA